MNDKDTKANFKLSSDFNEYIFRNPGILKVRGLSNSCVVFIDPTHPDLSEKNRDLGRKIIKEERKKCFQAIKLKKGWKLERLAV